MLLFIFPKQMFITCFRNENPIIYYWKWWIPRQSIQSLDGTRRWLTSTMEALLPRLYSWLVVKYLPRLLWWETQHGDDHQKQPVRIWRIHWYTLGYVLTMKTKSFHHLSLIFVSFFCRKEQVFKRSASYSIGYYLHTYLNVLSKQVMNFCILFCNSFKAA